MAIHNKIKRKGASLSNCTDYQTHLYPITCNKTIGWHHITETFHRQHSSLYELRIEPTGFNFYSGALRMGPIRCPETLVRNYHYSLRNNPEERTTQLLLPGSLKSRPIFCSSLRVQIQISYPQNMSNYYSLYTVHCAHLYILMLW
jgi:hypothetical protein